MIFLLTGLVWKHMLRRTFIHATYTANNITYLFILLIYQITRSDVRISEKYYTKINKIHFIYESVIRFVDLINS